MSKSEIIELLKQPAIDAFVKVDTPKRILPSILIAGALIKLDGFKEDNLSSLIAANNFHALKAGKKYTKETITIDETKFKVFESVEDFISAVTDYTGSVMSYEDALQKKALPDSIYNSYISTITSFDLDQIDEKAIEKLYSGESVIVETDGTTKDDQAKEVPVEKPTEDAKVDDTPKSISNTTKATRFDKGTKLNLINANLYTSPTSSAPTRLVSGTYYLADGVSRNGRYGIVMKEKFIGDARYIIGYVKKEQLAV